MSDFHELHLLRKRDYFWTIRNRSSGLAGAECGALHLDITKQSAYLSG
jgi:hypothetical protein